MGGGALSEQEKATIWRRVREGANWKQISRELGRHVSSVHGYAPSMGGVPPRLRRRCVWQLSLAEREEISRAGQWFVARCG